MYIPSHAALGNHPKLRRLARTLAVSRPAAIGHLHYLWWWSQEYAPDGDLSYQRYTAEDIADAALWDGDAYTFVDALKTSGFVDDIDGRLILHDWEEYGGKIAKDLAKDRERKRSKGNPPTSTAVPATSAGIPDTSSGVPPEFQRNSGVDKIKREERREEEKREKPPTPLPEKAARAVVVPNGSYRLFARFCEETDADEASVPPTEKGKQLAQAKAILAEHTEEEAVACLHFLESQSWRTGLIDLGTVRSEIGKWKMNGSPPSERARAPTNGHHSVTTADRKMAALHTTSSEFMAITGEDDGAQPIQHRDEPPGGRLQPATEHRAVARVLGPSEGTQRRDLRRGGEPRH